MPKKFKGNRKESEEEIFFHYSAKLRIMGENIDVDEISNSLNLNPTHFYKKGEKISTSGPACTEDRWFYDCPIDKSCDLYHHIVKR